MKRMIRASAFQTYNYSELSAAASNARKLKRGIEKILNDSKISESDVPYIRMGQDLLTEYKNNPEADGIITLTYAVINKAKTEMELHPSDKYGLVSHFTSLTEYQSWANSPQMEDMLLKTIYIEITRS